MEVTRILAKNIVNVDYGTLSPAVIEMTKKLTLDALACALGGSSAFGMKQLNELVVEWGGKEESTVVAFGNRVPAPQAALVNGSMGRALDFDDTHDVAGLHPAVPVVFAGLAIAEHKGGVGGREFIPAVALGIDLSCRLSHASPVSMMGGYGWDFSAIYGYFGATAVNAKILGLEESKILNAMGIAYHQSAGTMCQLVLKGYTTKAMGSGFAARGGLVSALMAERGLTGSNEPMDGEWGIFNLYQRGEYIPERLTGDLGKYFMVEDDSFKPYPCCRLNHPFIDAALALVMENDIKAEDVEKVVTQIGPHTYPCLCVPEEIKRKPHNSTASQFSLPWALANAIAYRKVEIGHFTDEAIRNEKILQLAHKVEMHEDKTLARREVEPGITEIITKKGKTYSKRVDHPLGSPQNPLSMKGLTMKFRNCASYAAKVIPGEKLDKAVQMVEGLEDVVDVGQIIRLLS